jgi:type II secretory pathway pseudopilin PulG
MNGGHEETLDTIALLALGALPADKGRDLAGHARDCAECRAEYTKLRVAADAVAFSAELRVGELDELSSARLKARVMNAVRANGAAVPGPASSGQAITAAAAAPRLLRSRTAWIPYVLAAAAVVIAILTSVNFAALRSQRDRYEQQVAELQSQFYLQSARESVTVRQLAALTAPGSKHFAVPSGDIVTSGGHVYLALRLTQPAPGKVYQAWTLRAGAKAVTPSVTFAPEPGGIAFVELPESAKGLAAVAVSVEPVGGSKAPTSTPAFVRSLS